MYLYPVNCNTPEKIIILVFLSWTLGWLLLCIASSAFLYFLKASVTNSLQNDSGGQITRKPMRFSITLENMFLVLKML